MGQELKELDEKLDFQNQGMEQLFGKIEALDGDVFYLRENMQKGQALEHIVTLMHEKFRAQNEQLETKMVELEASLARVLGQVGVLEQELQQQKSPAPPVPPPVKSPVGHALPGEDALREPGDRGRQDPLSRMEDPEVVYGPSSGMSHAGEMSEGDLYPGRYRKHSEKPREHMPLPSRKSAAHPPSDFENRGENRSWS